MMESPTAAFIDAESATNVGGGASAGAATYVRLGGADRVIEKMFDATILSVTARVDRNTTETESVEMDKAGGDATFGTRAGQIRNASAARHPAPVTS
jgi:hypothetical protein